MLPLCRMVGGVCQVCYSQVFVENTGVPEMFDRAVRAVMSHEGTHRKTLFSSSLARTHYHIFFYFS